MDKTDYKKVFETALFNSLIDFLKISGLKKKEFAQLYGCRDNYLSRILSGEKRLDIAPFMRVVLSQGYTPTLIFDPPHWKFEKTTPYDSQQYEEDEEQI